MGRLNVAGVVVRETREETRLHSSEVRWREFAGRRRMSPAEGVRGQTDFERGFGGPSRKFRAGIYRKHRARGAAIGFNRRAGVTKKG